MKIFLKIFIFFIIHNYTFAETSIAYIDLDSLLSKTNIGKNLFEKLNKSENLKMQELQEQEKKLKDEENKIIASKNLISEEQLKNDIKKFKKKLNDYKSLKSSELDKLQETRNNEVNNLLGTINSVIKSYMDENLITIIIDKKNIYIAHKKHDITDTLIELINKSIK